MTQRQYGPNDETQEIPYNPTQRETQAIPVRKKTPTSDSGLLRAVARGYDLEAEVDAELRSSGVFQTEVRGLYTIDSRVKIKSGETK